LFDKLQYNVESVESTKTDRKKMQQNYKTGEWFTTVCEQIRCKWNHDMLSKHVGKVSLTCKTN